MIMSSVGRRLGMIVCPSNFCVVTGEGYTSLTHQFISIARNGVLFKLKCGVAFELLVRVAREHVNLNAFTVLLVSICVWVRWFSQEENKRKITKIAWLEMLIKTDFHWYCALRKPEKK